jgi:hypothetical protein
MLNHIHIVFILSSLAKKLARKYNRTFTCDTLDILEIKKVHHIIRNSLIDVEQIRAKKLSHFASLKIPNFMTFLGDTLAFIVDIEAQIFTLGEIRQQIGYHLYSRENPDSNAPQSEEVTLLLKETWNDIYNCQRYFAESNIYLTHYAISDTHNPFS